MSFGGASIAMCLRLSALVGKELEELLLRETARHVGALKKRIGERALRIVQAKDRHLGVGSSAANSPPHKACADI
jgi:malate/lactate dehydrogenase